jgi:hypothetical protein
MLWWRRPDGDLVRDLPLNRRVMPYLMRGRNESAYYFEIELALRKTDAWVREFNAAHPGLQADTFHLALWAIRECMKKYPTMNRFVAGGRLYQRDKISFSYAVKQRLQEGAPIVVVKRSFAPDESFTDLVTAVQTQVHDDRFGGLTNGPSNVDKELALLMKFPGFARRIAMWGVRTGDRFGLLPASFIDHDPMFASAFVAHMASFGMPAGYHHLYEYGSAGIFVVLGRPTTDAGSPTSGPDRRRTMRVTYTFDERTEDGFTAWRSIQYFKRIVEDPAAAGLHADDDGDGGTNERVSGNGHHPAEGVPSGGDFGLASRTDLGGAPGMGPRLGAG